MPRSVFSSDSLRGAMPGISRLAQAIGQGGNAYQSGYDSELKMQSQLAQAMAAARNQNASADQTDAETDAFSRRPQMIDESVAMSTGSTLPMVRAVQEFVRTGQMPMKPPMGPAEEDGTLPNQFPVVDDATRTAISREMARMLPMRTNLKDTKPDDFAKGQETFGNMDLRDRVIRGELAPGQVGAAQAAMGGKPLFNSDANGAVLDLFKGALDTKNPMAQSTIGLKGAQGKQALAGAAENYAQAGKANAEAANARADGGGATKAPTGYRWNGGALEPIPGGPADPATKGAKLSKPPTEGQAKALMFGSRMAVSDEVLGELEKQGETQPGRIKQAVETLPIIGGALGMGVNSLPGALGGPNDQQQQVEQAQRDFINAVLRRESGAAIADSEFRNAQRQYFPQPGDSPAVRRQKASNRQTAISGFKAEFGEQSMPQFQEIVGAARSARQPSGAPASPAAPGKSKLSPAEQAELDQLRARFGKK